MNIQYYITNDSGQKQGPYDLVGMVKKIRNGSITATTLVNGEFTPLKPASEWPELAEFMAAQSQEESAQVETSALKSVSLTSRLRSGWNFLQHNQLSTIFSGLHVLFMIFATGFTALIMPKALLVIGYSVVFILTQFLFTGYIYSVLRMVRGQPVDFNFVKEKMRPLVKPLLISSLLMSFFLIVGFLIILTGNSTLSIIGLGIVAIPGFFTMSLFIFAPLLILDKGMDCWDAMETSRKTVQKSGSDTIGVIFALLVINFIAGLAFLIPMIVSLPITFAAISDMYDESFV